MGLFSERAARRAAERDAAEREAAEQRRLAALPRMDDLRDAILEILSPSDTSEVFVGTLHLRRQAMRDESIRCIIADEHWRRDPANMKRTLERVQEWSAETHTVVTGALCISREWEMLMLTEELSIGGELGLTPGSTQRETGSVTITEPGQMDRYRGDIKNCWIVVAPADT